MQPQVNSLHAIFWDTCWKPIHEKQRYFNYYPGETHHHTPNSSFTDSSKFRGKFINNENNRNQESSHLPVPVPQTQILNKPPIAIIKTSQDSSDSIKTR